MTTPNPSLKEMLLEDIPPGFVNELLAAMPTIYLESFNTMMNDPALGQEQAKGVLGHYRRARAETLLQETATRHGIDAKLVQPAAGGCTHIRVRMGRFQFVMCHVISRDAFPQHSDEREQSAKVNECIAQMSLLEEHVSLSTGEVFGIIIHTEITGRKEEFGSIKVGFPDPDWNGWAEEPIDLAEISDIQAKRYQKREDPRENLQKQLAKPKWKTQDEAANEQDE